MTAALVAGLAVAGAVLVWSTGTTRARLARTGHRSVRAGGAHTRSGAGRAAGSSGPPGVIADTVAPGAGETRSFGSGSGRDGDDLRVGPRGVPDRLTVWFTSRFRRDTAAEAALCITMVRRLSALLSAGRAPSTVFGAVVAAVPGTSLTAVHLRTVCAQVHSAAALGVPVSVPLARAAGSDPQLHNRSLVVWVRSVHAQVAACWEISEGSGASLARTLSGLADSLESQADAQAARESALAGPRATVRVLAWLPVLALGLGVLMGTDPVTTLLTTPWGRIALAAGAALTLAGRLWTRRLLRRAEGEPS